VSECACIGGGFDYFGPRVFHRKELKARKLHKCEECGETIKPREMYVRETGIWDGRWGSHETCMDCADVRDVLLCSYTYGTVWTTIHEHYADDPLLISWSAIGKLTTSAREKVCAMIEDIWANDGLDED